MMDPVLFNRPSRFLVLHRYSSAAEGSGDSLSCKPSVQATALEIRAVLVPYLRVIATTMGPCKVIVVPVAVIAGVVLIEASRRRHCRTAVCRSHE